MVKKNLVKAWFEDCFMLYHPVFEAMPFFDIFLPPDWPFVHRLPFMQQGREGQGEIQKQSSRIMTRFFQATVILNKVVLPKISVSEGSRCKTFEPFLITPL